VRSPLLKKNLYWKEVMTENKAIYQEARSYLEEAGFHIQAVVVDAKHGSKEVFSDLAVQICQYHQQQILQVYLTAKPKTEAGRELKALGDSISRLSERAFTDSLETWHRKWRRLLSEMTPSTDGRHRRYSYRGLRSAYRSLKTNSPYLFYLS
jgi:hypothetical protein